MIASIMSCLQINYGISAVALTLLPLGADVNASVYKAQTQEGSSYFVKLKRGHQYDISASVLALLQACAIEHIIAPIKTIRGKVAHDIDDFTLTLYPFVNGRNGFSQTLNEEQWTTLGRLLRQVHTCHVPPSLQDRIKKEDYSDKWPGSSDKKDLIVSENFYCS